MDLQKEYWKKYRSSGLIENNQDLWDMMCELTNTINNLKGIYGEHAELLTRALLSDWQNLMYLALARDLKYFPKPK